jgi:Tol biopolymer transport system component/DNA-binding winged helix-turn-helix (wHTH) protein
MKGSGKQTPPQMTTNRSAGHPSDRARFGPFQVDLHTHELWKFGTRLKLVGQPFEILAVLLARPGELVTREQLRDRLWPSDTFVDFNHGLNAAVNKLREALSDSAEAPRYIETLPRRGYRFIAPVEWIGGTDSSSSTQAPVPTVPPPPQAIATESSTAAPTEVIFGDATAAPLADRPTHGSWSRYLMGAGVLFLLCLAGVLIFKAVSGDRDASNRSRMERTRPLISISDTATPSFSPDGNSVAFFRERSQNEESGIYITVVGSDQLVQLTNGDHDCCPVWSPDGRSIAFTRSVNREYSIYVIGSDAGAEEKRKAEKAQSAAFVLPPATANLRKLDTGGVSLSRGEIDWSPDGKSIAFAGGSGIYLLNVADSSLRKISSPPPAASDWGPAFTPDARSVMFVRTQQMGMPDEIWQVPATGGEGGRILSERGRIASAPQWSYDGRSIIFSSNRTGHPALWRVALDAPDSAIQISEAGSPAWDPAVSRRGYRLAYERLLRSLSVWQMDLSENGDKRPYLIISSTSDTDQGPGPQFSPDGKRLAYMSDRSGTMEIWISNRDGSNAFQLSAVGGAGTPRWSPDSQWLAFDATTTGGSKIVTMNLHGGAPQILTQDEFHSVCPSWSHDGKWVYFASARSNDWQVWKVPAGGGNVVQVSRHGGHAGFESADGKYFYYAKNPAAEPEIWRVPVDGGEETLMPLVRPGTWASWQVVNTGILFIGPSLGHQAVLSFFDFAKNRTSTIAILDRTPFWMGATPDGETVAFGQPGREQDQAMLVENFR